MVDVCLMVMRKEDSFPFFSVFLFNCLSGLLLTVTILCGLVLFCIFLFLKIQLLFFFINSFVLNTDFLFHLCHVLLSIRIYYKYPVEAKKRENSLFSFFRFFTACGQPFEL